MSAWQAYNYLGCLLYPFKVLAQHKISVSPVEIPCCLRSYGKLTFVVERAVAVTKAAQGRTRLASLIPVTCILRRCPPASLVSLHTVRNVALISWAQDPLSSHHPIPSFCSIAWSCSSLCALLGPELGSLAEPCSWEVHPSCGWKNWRFALCCGWTAGTGDDIVSGSSASCLGSNPEQVVPPWMLSLLTGKSRGTVSWQGALWSVHESRFTWTYYLSFFSFLLSLLLPFVLHNLFSASACFLTLVFVWASDAVIIPRQGLARPNTFAHRHKNPQRIGPHDECYVFYDLELFLCVQAAILTSAKVPWVGNRQILIYN